MTLLKQYQNDIHGTVYLLVPTVFDILLEFTSSPYLAKFYLAY